MNNDWDTSTRILHFLSNCQCESNGVPYLIQNFGNKSVSILKTLQTINNSGSPPTISTVSFEQTTTGNPLSVRFVGEAFTCCDFLWTFLHLYASYNYIN